jgi:hypothetical protein
MSLPRRLCRLVNGDKLEERPSVISARPFVSLPASIDVRAWFVNSPGESANPRKH